MKLYRKNGIWYVGIWCAGGGFIEFTANRLGDLTPIAYAVLTKGEESNA